MPTVIKTTEPTPRYYGGETLGWIPNPPGPPPAPVDQAQRFKDDQEATNFMVTHGIKGQLEQVAQ